MMTASWRWCVAAVILLIIICSSLGKELQPRNQHSLDRPAHSYHGNPRPGRRRYTGRADNGDDRHSLTREERKRMREERRISRLERRQEKRQQRSNCRKSAHEIRREEPAEGIDLAWLSANLSSLWTEFRAFTKQHGFQAQGLRDHGSVPRGNGAQFVETEIEDDACPTGVDSCRDNEGQICSGHGECFCGHCQCDPEYYGSTCHCSDHTCESFDGMPCGGPSRGQCRCGGCVCRPGYIGEVCSCPTNIQTCIKPGNDIVCSNQGNCKCGRCECHDGYKGMYCEETVYAAGVCEKLKSCVLCKAWNRELSKCDQCQITVTVVDNLRPSMTTCVMVNSGCILKYSYIPQGSNAYAVLVERNSACPPEID
ncbi:integrin beta-2-like protein [Panulirus ornatus]|uniref:integrin beta-2-like protein n=1 Tax=Panulirus ornatus TaxID=150431 RepID=UPI003A845290